MILYNVLLPLAAGAGIVLLLNASAASRDLQACCLLLLFLGLYWLLEGWPAFPPISAKQKLGFGLLALGIVIAVGSQRGLPLRWVSFIALLAFATWLGWAKLHDPSQWAGLAVALLPALAVGFAGETLESRSGEPWLWPVSVLAYAIGAAIVTVLGGFIGMAQLLGASAAALGGMLLVSFVLTLMGKSQEVTPSGAPGLAVVVSSIIAIAIVAGLFAPSLNRAAFAILPLALLVPLFFPRHRTLSPVVAPFAIGSAAILPVFAAVALTWFGGSAPTS